MRPHACGSGGARGGGEHSSGGSRPSTRPPTKQHKRLADVRAAGANGQPARGRHARQVVLGHQPVRQQNNTKGMRTPAPRAPLGSPPAADTRPGVLQQTRAVWGAGAALPRCPGPRSADLKRAPSNFSKSGRDGRRGAAAQHTHYGAVHRDAGQPRAMRASSAPPGACSARSRAPHALSSRFSARFSARFSERQTRAIFPPKKILTISHGSVRGGMA